LHVGFNSQKIPLHFLLPKLGPNALPEQMELDVSVQLLGAEGVLIKAHVNSMLRLL
jgi:hypothetical protein